MCRSLTCGTEEQLPNQWEFISGVIFFVLTPSRNKSDLERVAWEVEPSPDSVLVVVAAYFPFTSIIKLWNNRAGKYRGNTMSCSFNPESQQY